MIEPDDNPARLLSSLLLQANRLLTEVSNFQVYLRTQKKENFVEVRSFRSNVLAETKALRKFEKLHLDSNSRSERNGSNVNGGNQVSGLEDAIADVDIADPGCQGSSLSPGSIAVHKGEDESIQDEVELEAKSLHALRSSNIPFLDALWGVAKRCHGLTAVSKRHWTLPKPPADVSNHSSSHVEGTPSNPGVKPTNAAKNVLVDVVSSDGNLWTKVSLLTERRLVFDMAKEGYGMYDSEEEPFSDEDEDPNPVFNQSEPDLEILRTALDLRNAALVAPRVNYEHPKIRFVFTRLDEGVTPQIDSILSKIRQYGVQVICRNTPGSTDLIPQSSPSSTPPVHNPPTLFQTLAPTTSPIPTISNHPSRLTPTLNLDCTILLALLSDISHLSPSNLPPPPSGSNSFHAAVRAQIASEASATRNSERLLTGELWPMMSGRKLVTTRDAAVRMAEIVRTIGTDSEKQRVRGLFGSSNFDLHNPENVTTSTDDAGTPEEIKRQNEECISHLHTLTDHPIPDTLILPIQILDLDPDLDTTSSSLYTTLPSYAPQVMTPLSQINKSVFLTGWSMGITTVTSNRSVAKEIEGGVWRGLDEEGEKTVGNKGPLMYIIGTARSLIGKEKGHR